MNFYWIENLLTEKSTTRAYQQQQKKRKSLMLVFFRAQHKFVSNFFFSSSSHIKLSLMIDTQSGPARLEGEKGTYAFFSLNWKHLLEYMFVHEWFHFHIHKKNMITNRCVDANWILIFDFFPSSKEKNFIIANCEILNNVHVITVTMTHKKTARILR